MVNLGGNVCNFLLQRLFDIVSKGELRLSLAEAHDLFCQSLATFSALCPNLRQHYIYATLLALLLYQSKFFSGIGWECIDGNNYRKSIDGLDVVNVAKQVRNTLFKSLNVLLVKVCFDNASVVLKSANGCYQNNSRWSKTGSSTLDVQELLGTKVCAKACLGNNVICKTQSSLCCLNGIATVSNVGKRSTVNKSRCVLKRLDQVRLNSVFEQRCHSTLGMDIADGNRLAVIGVGNNHSAQALFKVFDAGSKAEYSHDLGGNGNIKAVLSWHAVCNAAKSVNNVSELAIVHVNAALPHNTTWINVETVSLLDMIIQHGSTEIICSANSVEVTGKVKVDVFHRNYLGISTARSTTLDTKDGAQRRLPEGQHGRLSQAGQSICQTN